MKWPTLIVSASLAALLIGAPIAAADDTEIFFTRPAANGSRAANVMFMFDTSGSMNGLDGGDVKRINRVKQAMLQVLDDSDGVNIGLGAFNGTRQGGAILYPTVNPRSVVCPGPDCGTVMVRAAVETPSDDAEQRGNGTMLLNNPQLAMFESLADGSSFTTETFRAGNGADDAMQRTGIPLELDDTTLPLFYYPNFTDATNSLQIGLRFPVIDIPQGAQIEDARVHFTSTDYGSNGNVAAEIRLDSASDSLPFADSLAQRVNDRLSLDTVVPWPDIPKRKESNEDFSTPDLSDLLNERIGRTDWSSGEALTFMLSLTGETDDKNFRAFKAYEDDPDLAPRLVVSWTASNVGNAVQTVGLRFAGLDVPRGATITSATLEFAASADGDDPTSFAINGESSGNALPFTTTSYNLGTGARARTVASVPWNTSSWQTAPLRNGGVRYNAERRYRSPNFSAVVQEIVNRTDWCGGNALALLLEGSGLRKAWSRDDSEWSAPIMRIGYDPDSVLPASTCVSRTLKVAVGRSSDDAVQAGTTGTGAVTLDEASLTPLASGSPQTVGLRFSTVDVPPGATISDARLLLTSTGSIAGTADLRIVGQNTGYAPAYVTGTDANIGIAASTTSVDWNDLPALPAGERLRSPDIAAVIQQIVDNSAWLEGNALALKLSQTSGSGERLFSAYDFDIASAAVLEIDYQLEGSDLGDTLPALRTAGDEMRDRLLDFEARGGTPIVDSYYEAASYMLGEAVDFGRTRGNQTDSERYFRTSSELSWNGGTLYRPPGCTTVDANAVACVNEEVSEGALYKAPVAGACQVNQIVLLSDGSATHNNIGSRVTTLTGDSACTGRGNSAENCGIELATWLNSLDGDGSANNPGRIITHTIGFNFSTPFLSELATAGGGRSEEAGSATELANVFNAIVNEAADLNTTFVAPAASVNRFNRLTNSNDVYYAMFKPDTTMQWDGNLKRYELNTPSGSDKTTIVDRLGLPIFDQTVGGIKASAKSFWPQLDSAGNAVSTADGSSVAAGGAAHQLPSTRDVRTFLYGITGLPGPLVQLHETTAALNSAVLNITGLADSYKQEVLRWSRGVDVRDADGDGDTTEVRQQIGDPMHTTPFILHYDNDDDDLSRVFVGTNQGYLHAIDAKSGAESWAVVPPELLPNLARFMENGTTGTRPYGLDGGIMGWIEDTDGDQQVDAGEDAYVVVGMRRGGGNYYAFDVSSAFSPTLAWIIRAGDTGFEDLGQTWSTPVRTRMLVSGTPTDVLVFAGGYDANHDAREERITDLDEKGAAVYIVDASDGSLIKSLRNIDYSDMDYSIPGDMNVIDVDFDGLADLMFVGDMGGQLWRFDIDNSDQSGSAPTEPTITGGVIASMNGGAKSGNRRFYQRPDVALLKGPDGSNVLNIAIGSGWRAHPLDNIVQDRLYSIRQQALFGAPRNASNVVAYDMLTEADLFNATSVSGSQDTSGKINAGWFIDLESNGEKALANALTLDGTLLFTTYLPDSDAVNECSVSVGGGRLYKVDALFGDAVENLSTDAVDDSGEQVIDLDDRWRTLNVPGIPTAPQVYVEDPDAPIIATGDGTEDSGLGKGTKRTFWVEN